jgi:putative inorganic carbon (HCO3(-)) transporter
MTRVTATQGAGLKANLDVRIRPGHLWLSIAVLLVGLALALLPVRWIVVALPGLVVVGLVGVRPHLALYLLCFAIPFGSLYEVEIGGGITIGVTEVLIGLAAAAWLARTMAWRLRTGWPRLTVALTLFVGAVGFSLLNVTSLPHALKEIAKWIEFLVVLLIVANTVDRAKSQRLVTCLLMAGIGQAALGAYQFLTRSGPEFFAVGRFIRAYGTFEQPNPYAGYLGIVAPLALALVLVSGGRPSPRITGRASAQASSGSIPSWLKWLALGSLVATSMGIGMSASRGAWLAYGAAFVAVNISQSRRGASIFLTLIVFALFVGLLGGFRLLPVGITQRLTSFLPFVGARDVRSIEVTDANYASLERLAFWQAALDMWRDFPLLGVGLGNYPIAYARYSLPKWRMALGHAHNYYLNVAAETGLIGLLAYLALWAAAVWQTVQANRQSCDVYAHALALGAFGVLVHVHVHNVVDNLWVHNMYIHVAIILGLVQSQFVSAEFLGDAC